jgi:heme-degrading monooxygenase HmoA
VGVYLSMQRVRFSSPDAYDKFRTVFSNVRHHLMNKPGFIHLTWWEHPDEPGCTTKSACGTVRKR